MKYLVLLMSVCVSLCALEVEDRLFLFNPDDTETPIGYIEAADGQTRACTTPNAESFNILLPKTEGNQFQVLGLVDNNGTLSWITTITGAAVNLLTTATSADIPLTLVLRDSTGSFAASIVTVSALFANALTIKATTTQGCLIFTNSGSGIIGEICVNQNAMIIAPVAPRAIQATLTGNTRGASAIDFQLSITSSNEVASGNFAAIPGGQNNIAAGTNSFAAGTNAQALDSGAFVWADNTNQPFTDSGANTFNVRANGGAVFALQAPSNATDISLTITADNSVQPAVSLTTSGTLPVISLEWRVRGTGAIFATSDSAVTRGAQRGANAVDLQMSRTAATQVASGDFSVISGGGQNVASGIYSVIGGGFVNSVSGAYSGIVSGSGNVVVSQFSCVASGQNNQVLLGDFSVICGGLNNAIVSGGGGATQHFLGAGQNNMITGGANCGLVAGASNTLSGLQTFLGAGTGNICTGTNSFLGAGNLNHVSALDAGILAGSSNTVTGDYSAIGAGQSNTVTGTLSGIFCGLSNTIGLNNGSCFIGAGSSNIIPAGINQTNSVIVAGQSNTISGTGSNSAIVAGQHNTISGNALNSFIGSGFYNVCASGYSCIVSGSGNTLPGQQFFASGILSGIGNSVNDSMSSVLGGQFNQIFSGANSAILSGSGCQIFASFGLAAGHSAVVTNTGSFVWADSTSAIFTDSTANSFNARASGGFYLSSNSTGTINLRVPPGGNSWISLSDKSYKTHAQSVDTVGILSTLNTVPINTWNLVGQNDSIIHIGPYAGDFNSAFGYGEDPMYINQMDAIGVLMASVQGLYQLYQTSDKHISLDAYYLTKNYAQKQLQSIAELEERIKQLEVLHGLE